MAGSGSRPLPNIPYCCLPQESGPCLSTSVGDRPLRSPSHRRLGGPSPRRLSNGTHARPRPPELSPPGDAPVRPHGALPGVSTGCAPVGGWLHTRCAPVRHSRRPEGRLPFDLHVLGLPLAFILSQDQTLRCSIAVLLNYSESRVPLLSAHHCAGVSLASFSLRPASPKEHRPQCWPQTLNELCAPVPLFQPHFSLEVDCKSTTFLYSGKQIFQLFLIKYDISLSIRNIKFQKVWKTVGF